MVSHQWWPEEQDADGDVPHLYVQAGLASAAGGVPPPAAEEKPEGEQLGDGLD